jgi:ketosteroid isomerase-like protein
VIGTTFPLAVQSVTLIELNNWVCSRFIERGGVMPTRALTLIVAGLLLAPAGLATPVLAQDATPAAECVTTTETENKEIVQAFYAAADSGSPEDFANVLASDHVFRGPINVAPGETAGGADSAAGWVGEWEEAATDVTVSVDQLVAEDDTVMALVTWSGTDADTGNDASWNGVGVFRIECGKIAETWAVGDQLGRLMALGVVTEEELAEVTAETPSP